MRYVGDMSFTNRKPAVSVSEKIIHCYEKPKAFSAMAEVKFSFDFKAVIVGIDQVIYSQFVGRRDPRLPAEIGLWAANLTPVTTQLTAS